MPPTAPTDPSDSHDVSSRVDVLHAFTEAAADAIVTATDEGLILSANTGITEIFGYVASSLIGKPLETLMPERLRAAHRAGMQRYVASGERTIPWRGVHLTGLRRDGSEVPLEISFGEFREGGKRVLLGIMRDLTPRHAAEQAQRQSEERFRQLADNVRAVLWLRDEDENRAIYISSQIEAIWGITADEFYNDPSTWSRSLHPADRERTIARRAATRDGTYDVEYRIIRGDGAIRWIHDRGYPVRNEHGDVYRRAGVAEDITERKEAEMRLAQAEAHYRRFVENSPYAVYALDLEGRFTEVNPAGEELLGRSAESLMGQPFSIAFAPDEAEMFARGRENMLTGSSNPERLEAEVTIVRPSGEKRLAHVRSMQVTTDGHVTGTHGIARDITDHAIREQQLRRVEKLASVGTLIAGVAHELNNPLHAIRTFTELMLLDSHSAEDTDSLILMKREADRAAKIVSDLRLFARQSRIESSVREVVDLNEIASHVLKVRGYTMATRNIEVRLDLSEVPALVAADRSEIEQVVMNLVVNAEQAMSEETEERCISVRTYVTPGSILMRVMDTGIGIPQDEIEQIFDPFFTKKSTAEGTGLGLALVYAIVTEHGGHISVDSAPGKGASFLLQFPRCNESSGQQATAVEAVSSGAPLRVLIIDDEPTIRLVMRRYLSRIGHEVTEAADGYGALKYINAEVFDVIISDLRMPGLDGEQLLTRICERNDGTEKKMIFLTGDASTADVAMRLEASGIPVLTKPLGLREIGEAVERVARGQQIQARG